jgi:hypothetical protein
MDFQKGVGQMAVRSRLFGQGIEPSCCYCESGSLQQDGSMILCSKRGIVSPDFRCWRFQYAPLKRVPNRLPLLPEFSPEDFSL